MSKLEVDKIDPQSGTNLELGTSGDTITVPTGVTLDASNATTSLPANVVTTDGTQTLTNKTIDASQLTGTITPSDGTVTNAKIVDSTIELAKLSATGTKDSTTFLRGDNTFASPAGGGKVLQVVTATEDNQRSTTSTTFTDIPGLSVSITPSATSSKVLVMCTTTGYSGNTVEASEFTLLRGSTNLGSSITGEIARIYGANDIHSSITMIVLDSPSTTSATTYKAQFRRSGASGTAAAMYDNSLGTITVMEIGA